MEIISYKERLDKLGLFLLEYWRLRDELTDVYKIPRGIEMVESFFKSGYVKYKRAQFHDEREESLNELYEPSFFVNRVKCLEGAGKQYEADKIATFKMHFRSA